MAGWVLTLPATLVVAHTLAYALTGQSPHGHPHLVPLAVAGVLGLLVALRRPYRPLRGAVGWQVAALVVVEVAEGASLAASAGGLLLLGVVATAVAVLLDRVLLGLVSVPWLRPLLVPTVRPIPLGWVGPCGGRSAVAPYRGRAPPVIG